MATTRLRPAPGVCWQCGRIVLAIGLGLALAGTVRSRGQTSIALVGTNVVLSFPTATNLLYDIQRRDDLLSGWSTVTSNIPGTGGMWTNIDVGAAAAPARFYRVRSYTPGTSGGTVGILVEFADETPAPLALVLINYSGAFHTVGFTDGAGQVTATNVPAGGFTVRAYSPSNGALFTDVAGTVTNNGDAVGVTAILPGTGAVAATVKYPSGSPASLAPVYITYGSVTDGPSYTALDGMVTLQGIPVGNFTVRAYNPHNSSSYADGGGTVSSNGALASVTINLATN